jgi:transforming growth factor-beta-induced protein
MKMNGIACGIVVMLIGILLIAGCAAPSTPPPTPTPTTLPPTTTVIPTTAAAKTIVETAAADGNFTTLVTAITAANLTDTLNGPGAFTVFAPTDAAFQKLPAGTVDTLLADPQGQLTQILLYHVVSGEFTAEDLMNLTTVETLQGGNLTISVVNSSVKVDNATVIAADIQCSNGIIHAIDEVLIPS